MWHIEEAKSTDIEYLIDLLTQLFSKEAEFIPNRTLQRAGLEAILANEDIGKILVIKDNHTIVGMVSLLWSISTALGGKVAFLEDMVVHFSLHGKGLGSHLLEYAMTYAKEQGCKRVTLLSDNDNTDAHRFYERFGFQHSSMIPMRFVFA